MGIEYAIINRKSRTFYWLGKGPWFDIGHDLEILSDLEILTQTLKNIVFELDDKGSFYYSSKEWLGPQLDRVSLDLTEFAQGATESDLLLVNDTGDGVLFARCLGYKCVGSIYSDSEDRNYHLDPINIGRYTRDQVSKTDLDWYEGRR
jgi:hypothetical protein